MSLLFLDSFDDRTGNAERKYDSSVLSTAPTFVAGRTGNALSLNTSVGSGVYVEKVVTTGATFIIGAAIKINSTGQAQQLFSLYDGATLKVSVDTNTSGQIVIKNAAGTTLGTGSTVLSTSAFKYVEAKIFINNSTGSVTVKIDGAIDIAVTGVNTSSSGTAQATKVRLGGVTGAGTTIADDFYIANTAGSVNNDFLGTLKIECLFPTGAGNTTQWTPSAGSNYQCVDDTNPNDATDYVSDLNVGDKDTYAMGNMAATSGIIVGVQTVIRAKCDNPGSGSLKKVLRSGGADYDGAAVTLTTSYANYREIDETDPATSAAWTISNVNAVEAGLKVA